MTWLLHSPADVVLPAAPVERILILRTAQLPEIQWALGELAERYPNATVGVLGTRLKALGAFASYVQFEVAADWLTPRTVRPLLGAIRQFDPDLLVLCLNNDWCVGYERASRIVRSIPARSKVVAGYGRRWHRWEHMDFIEGPRILRWLVNATVLALYPMVAMYLLCRPSRPLYGPSARAVPSREARV